jgi:pimeloyl-ACP methyl ester carboxylesterase
MKQFLKPARWLVAIAGALCVVAVIVLAVFRTHGESREVRIAAQAAPPSGRFMVAGDVTMFVQEEGDAAAPAVVLIHGTGAWSETWRGTMKALAQAGFRAIALDLPPFGYSERPGSRRYERPDQARRILGALDALKLEHVILVGHSFGAGPTVEATLISPKRIRALVLVDAALGLQTPTAESGGLLSRLLQCQWLRDSLVATFLTNPRFTRRLLQAFIADASLATDERTAIYQQPLDIIGTTAAVGAWLPALLTPAPGSRSGDVLAYRSLAMPVYLIWGALDTVTPLQQAEHLQRITPGSNLLVMRNVGHIPQLEDAGQFNKLLLNTLAHYAGTPISAQQ